MMVDDRPQCFSCGMRHWSVKHWSVKPISVDVLQQFWSAPNACLRSWNPALSRKVFEVWDSRESRGAFMASRLGPALAQAQLSEPKRLEWLTVKGHYSP